MRARGRRIAAPIAAVAVALRGFTAGQAHAQTLEVERARTLLFGSSPTAASTDRVDAARTGLSRSPLPASGLHTAWRVALGAFTDRAPVVDAKSVTYVVGTRGEVIAVGRDGSESWRVSTGVSQPGPATLLSDNTLVFVSEVGEAVAVREGRVRWRTRFGRGAAIAVAPLSLDDGGVVVATAHELAALDADGGERARTTVTEAIAAPLVSALGRVVVVTASGAIWAWKPGAAEPTRVGAFGGPVDGGAALADDHTLVAVTTSHARFCAVDLGQGTSSTRAVTSDGLWLGPPTMNGETAYLLLDAPATQFAVALDAAGSELARTLIGLHPVALVADGGAGFAPPGPHTPTLVDTKGTLVFATGDGGLGVVAAAATGRGSVERLSDACPTTVSLGGRSETAVAGVAPLPPDGFVATCRSGALIAVRGGPRP